MRKRSRSHAQYADNLHAQPQWYVRNCGVAVHPNRLFREARLQFIRVEKMRAPGRVEDHLIFRQQQCRRLRREGFDHVLRYRIA